TPDLAPGERRNAPDRHCHRGWRACGFDRRRDAWPWGLGVVLADPHESYPPDFRAEKIDGTQARVLRKTGLADAVLRAATLDGESWVARFGRLVEKRPGDQHGILYDTLVNTIRGEIPPAVSFVHGKVMDVATSAQRQKIALSTGEEI